MSAYIELCSCQFDGLKLPWLSVHETDIYANRYQTNSVCCVWLICLHSILSLEIEHCEQGRKITKILQILILLNQIEFYWVRNHDRVPSITSTGTLNHVLKFCCALVNCSCNFICEMACRKNSIIKDVSILKLAHKKSECNFKFHELNRRHSSFLGLVKIVILIFRSSTCTCAGRGGGGGGQQKILQRRSLLNPVLTDSVHIT